MAWDDIEGQLAHVARIYLTDGTKFPREQGRSEGAGNVRAGRLEDLNREQCPVGQQLHIRNCHCTRIWPEAAWDNGWNTAYHPASQDRFLDSVLVVMK